MKTTMISFLFLLFLELLAVATITVSFSNGSTYVGCIQSEREALLSFKQDLNDTSNRLSSWVGDHGDCCKWDAVVCSNFTGHVVELHLGNPISNYSYSVDYRVYERSMLRGKINSSLLDLKHLVYLDLSGNDFGGHEIPRFIGNLSSLQYLDLSNNPNFYDMLYVESLNWLFGLPSLKYLDLSMMNLSVASDWLLDINKLSSLTLLRLSNCQLQHIPPLPFANFTSSLTTLDLSENLFDNSYIPSWVFSLRNLEFLDLGGNNFHGLIPDGLRNFTSLQHLDLSNNYFNSSIPNWLSIFNSLEFLDLGYNNNLQGTISKSWGRLCNLKSLSLSSISLNQDIFEILHILSECIIEGLKELEMGGCQLFGQLTNDQLGQAKNLEVLDISSNYISGFVPSCLGELSFLHFLDISYNKLNGTLTEIHFANLTRLTYLHASGNSLRVNHDWVPPFQLQRLTLRSCHLGHQFPPWLHSQQSLDSVDISNSGIVDSIPSWFWRSISQFVFLNLSHNQIQGGIPNVNIAPYLWYLNLRSNNLSGPLPLVSPTIHTLYLSNNAFSGSIFHFLCHKINEPRRTKILKLGNNFLSKELPDCWMNWQDLFILELGDNNFTGNIPFSIGYLNDLASLHLRNNSLSGAIPTSLSNCTSLVTLDIGENEFLGSVPTWLGQSFSNLVILNFRSNKFHGLLPTEFCHLTSLQILDLAYNNLSGSIPSCIHSFNAMATMNYSKGNSIQLPGGSVEEIPIEDATVVTKGTVAQYKSILNLVRSLDLSKNNFSGEIPMELTSLHALQSLNLSHNSLTGRIPDSIGDMRDIESIDLSANQLNGKIPQSITGLTFLNHLNLSNNKFTGRIPSSTQLQSFNASSFAGNELCGSPLKNCTIATVPTPRHENGEHEVDWFYVSMALGFVVGFWSLIGPLLINRRWRYMYCRFLDRLGDKFYFGFKKLC